MKKICFATNNPHKVSEISDFLPKNYEILTLTQLGCLEEIPETQPTIRGNAEQKAHYVWMRYKSVCPACFADDTGLLVEDLGGKPGVLSARYAGANSTDEDNRRLLLANMEGRTNRQAYFLTVICFFDAAGNPHFFEGKAEGEILTAPKGEKGFGYDSVFRPKGSPKTFAEMSRTEKNQHSHRGKAVKKFLSFLAEKA